MSGYSRTASDTPWWKEPTKDQWYAYCAAWMGWTLDAFDFFLLVFVLKDIAAEFQSDITEVTFAILLTLAMRPLGAYLFGRAADRWGRRPTLMVDLARHLRRRHGRRMGRRRLAHHGIDPTAGARLGLRPPPIGLSGRLFPRLDRLWLVVPIYRLARHVHGRRHSRPARALHQAYRAGIAELEPADRGRTR